VGVRHVNHASVSVGTSILGAVVNLGGTGQFIHWGAVQISLANLIVIGVMIVLFLAAIFLPFPGHRTRQK
jgi:ABC-type proline/glycine betaine transport system permease subunit